MPDSDISKCTLKTQLNNYFALGGIVACLIGSPIIRLCSRRYINLFLIIINGFLSLAQFIFKHDEVTILVLRFLIGICSSFYTFITPITFKEYILGNISANLSSTFYIGIAFGTFISLALFFHSKTDPILTDSEQYDYLPSIFLIPFALEIFRFVSLFYFFSESPRFSALMSIKNHSHIKDDLDNNPVNRSTNPLRLILKESQVSLNEDYENRYTESYFRMSDASIKSNDENIQLRREHLLSQKNNDLKEALKKDPQILRYFEKFFKYDKQDSAFNFFFNEFIKTYDQKFVKKNFFKAIFEIAFSRKYRLQFFVTCLLNFLNQMTGINCLIFYSSIIFTVIEMKSIFLLTSLLGTLIIHII
jgi:hypothetical protein